MTCTGRRRIAILDGVETAALHTTAAGTEKRTGRQTRGVAEGGAGLRVCSHLSCLPITERTIAATLANVWKT